jgi:hypothetical protein
MLNEGESGMVKQVGNIGRCAGKEIIHAQHMVALRNELVAKMRAQKTGTTRNQNPHQKLPR